MTSRSGSWNNIAFGFFLFGGAVGGVVFGVISDRIGRSKTMILTILFYSLFTCASAFAQSAWQMVVLRFLVAMGVGGEWAVAAAMVAEVMPTRSRPVMSSIFHASSVFGTLLAAATVALLIGNEAVNAWLADRGWEGWRIGFAIGVLPALLTLWIRWKLHEPESWKRVKEQAEQDPDQATRATIRSVLRGQSSRDGGWCLAGDRGSGDVLGHPHLRQERVASSSTGGRVGRRKREPACDRTPMMRPGRRIKLREATRLEQRMHRRSSEPR